MGVVLRGREGGGILEVVGTMMMTCAVAALQAAAMVVPRGGCGSGGVGTGSTQTDASDRQLGVTKRIYKKRISSARLFPRARSSARNLKATSHASDTSRSFVTFAYPGGNFIV
mgnify:CR=1 FL=1